VDLLLMLDLDLAVVVCLMVVVVVTGLMSQPAEVWDLLWLVVAPV
jgi:hypothetical protein